MSGADKKPGLSELADRAIWLLFAVIVGYLLLASIFSTCYLGGYRYPTADASVEVNIEHTFYIRDHFLQHIVVFLLFSLCLLCIKAGRIGRVIRSRYFVPAVCIVSGVLAAAFVLAGQYYPKYDQMHVIEAAARLNRHVYSDFDRGEYLFVFPFQTGTVTYFRLLTYVFGENHYVAFQLVNCLWIAMAYWLFAKIARILWGGDRQACEAGTALAGLLFAPYLLYATFLYGTVVGMAFALLSFYMMLCCERDARWWQFFLCGLSMGIATVVKSNYMIFMIAQILCLLLRAWTDRRDGMRRIVRRLALILVLLVFFAAGRWSVDAYVRAVNQGNEVKGIPMTAWVAMGLQDGKAAPGWYNGYNNGVFIENDFDYDRTSDAVMAEIERIVRGYPENLRTSVSFFVKKISSQWNNPTFQSLWILEEREGRGGLAWLLHGKGRYAYTFWVNLMHTWMLAGVFLYAVLRRRKHSVSELLLPLTFVGGFVFHIFWEAEGLYAILYIPLLLPMCICGYGEWRSWLLARRAEFAEAGKGSAAARRMERELMIGAAVVTAVCVLSYTDPFAKLIARNENTGVFDVYTQETVDEKNALPE